MPGYTVIINLMVLPYMYIHDIEFRWLDLSKSILHNSKHLYWSIFSTRKYLSWDHVAETTMLLGTAAYVSDKYSSL